MNPVRHLAELLSRGKVFRRRLPQKYGGAQFYVTPEAGLRYYHSNLGSVDPTLLNLAVELVKPGAVVWDIGANVGLFSFAAAGLAGSAGKVYAVEPDTYLVRLLHRSCCLRNNGAAPVAVIPCAVAESLRLEAFHIAQRARSCNFLAGHGTTQTGGIRETQDVLTITLDWLATQISAPDLIKIDVEGADLRVLQGALQILRKSMPVLICEANRNTAEEITALLKGLGYTLFDGDQPKQSRQPSLSATHTTLAVPRRLNAVAFES